MIKYKVETWSNSVELSKLNIVKVTEKTVLTDKGFRYHKKCQAYEIFDSFHVAKKTALIHTKRHMESLKHRLDETKKQMAKLNYLCQDDLK